tara:strand:- start:1189 stop:1428 length:240 start_codon:yes stop_codon:yes gene_type:complete
LHRRQKQAYENANNRDHDQQFDEREAWSPPGAGTHLMIHFDVFCDSLKCFEVYVLAIGHAASQNPGMGMLQWRVEPWCT